MSSSSSFPANAKQLKLRVYPAAERAIRGGHPWVYADSVKESNRQGMTGDIAVIYDRSNRFMALALFDADSPIQIRVLHVGKPVKLDTAWWGGRIDEALDRRMEIQTDTTTGCRLIHGENDGFPGLVVDRYNDVLVLKIYSAGWLSHIDEIEGWLRKRFAPRTIVLRLSRNIQDSALIKYGMKEGAILHGEEIHGPIVFMEHGILFEADVLKGQKTGFFLDQRDNRQIVGKQAPGCDVLNAFSFSGGFSLHAARGGARSVVDLDISKHALASARRNFELNEKHPRISECKYRGIQADVFEWMAQDDNETFDLIIVDPPSLARREKEREGAIYAYQQLASSAIKRLRKGGLLLACSCSAHVSQEEFNSAVRQAAKSSGRPWKEFLTTDHPRDHHKLHTFKEASYLKGIYLRF
ncbi:class I SAM-dependent rRNA methyltransferase [Verrucomicrobia bacterium]|nr:class I SAM-dependent rRNA methyltransferase [Verrucomicrobiota bacterium]